MGMRATVILSAHWQELLLEDNYSCQGAEKMAVTQITHMITILFADKTDEFQRH